MAQAIEEGFILDVLTNYSTYDMFLRVKNELDNSEEEPLVDTGHAVTAIVQFARLHPTAIAQKCGSSSNTSNATSNPCSRAPPARWSSPAHASRPTAGSRQ